MKLFEILRELSYQGLRLDGVCECVCVCGGKKEVEEEVALHVVVKSRNIHVTLSPLDFQRYEAQIGSGFVGQASEFRRSLRNILEQLEQVIYTSLASSRSQIQP